MPVLPNKTAKYSKGEDLFYNTRTARGLVDLFPRTSVVHERNKLRLRKYSSIGPARKKQRFWPRLARVSHAWPNFIATWCIGNRVSSPQGPRCCSIFKSLSLPLLNMSSYERDGSACSVRPHVVPKLAARLGERAYMYVFGAMRTRTKVEGHGCTQQRK